MLIRLLFALLVLPSPALATVDWTEGFEYAGADNAAKKLAMDAVWSTSCPGTSTIMWPSTTRAHSGTQSLQKHYFGHQPNNASCFMDRYLSAVSKTLWVRYWLYMENFTVDYIGTKLAATYSNGQDPSVNGWGTPWFEMMWGTPNLGMNVRPILLYCGQYQPTGACSTASIDSENVYGGIVPQNQWVCIEAQLIQADPGVDNGVMRQWINGTQTLNKTTQRMGRTQDTTLTWQFIREYVQDGDGEMFVDDWAVSRDARIGCGSTPPTAGDTRHPPLQLR